jgi:hypothetical protein
LEAAQLVTEDGAHGDLQSNDMEADDASLDDEHMDESSDDEGSATADTAPSSQDISDNDLPTFMDEEESEDQVDPRAKVLSVLELEDLFKNAAPDLKGAPTFVCCDYENKCLHPT